MSCGRLKRPFIGECPALTQTNLRYFHKVALILANSVTKVALFVLLGFGTGILGKLAQIEFSYFRSFPLFPQNSAIPVALFSEGAGELSKTRQIAV